MTSEVKRPFGTGPSPAFRSSFPPQPKPAKASGAAAPAGGGGRAVLAQMLDPVWDTQAFRFKTNLENRNFDAVFIRDVLSGIAKAKSTVRQFGTRLNEVDFTEAAADEFVAANVSGVPAPGGVRGTFLPPADKDAEMVRITRQMGLTPSQQISTAADATGVTILSAVAGHAILRKETNKQRGMLSDQDRLTGISLVLLAGLGLSNADENSGFPQDGQLYQAALEPMLSDAHERAFGWHDGMRYGPLLQRHPDLVQATLLAATLGLTRLETTVRGGAGGAKAAKAWSAVFASRLSPVWRSASDEKSFTDLTSGVAAWPKLQSQDIADAQQQAQQGRLLPAVVVVGPGPAARPAVGAPTVGQQQLAGLFAQAPAGASVAAKKPVAAAGALVITTAKGQMPQPAELADMIIDYDEQIQAQINENKALVDKVPGWIQDSGMPQGSYDAFVDMWIRQPLTTINDSVNDSVMNANEAKKFKQNPKATDAQIGKLISAYVNQSLVRDSVVRWNSGVLELAAAYLEEDSRRVRSLAVLEGAGLGNDLQKIKVMASSESRKLLDELKTSLGARTQSVKNLAAIVTDPAQSQIPTVNLTVQQLVQQVAQLEGTTTPVLGVAETMLNSIANVSTVATAQSTLQRSNEQILSAIDNVRLIAAFQIHLFNRVREFQQKQREQDLTDEADAWLAQLANRAAAASVPAQAVGGASPSPLAGLGGQDPLLPID